MGGIGQTLRYYDFILSSSEWMAPSGVVSTAEVHQIGLSACTAAFYTGRRRPGYLHDETVFPRLSIKISDGRDFRGNIIAPIRRRHNFFHLGLRDYGSHPL